MCVCELICVRTQVFQCIIMFVYVHVLLFETFLFKETSGGYVSIDQNVQQ